MLILNNTFLYFNNGKEICSILTDRVSETVVSFSNISSSYFGLVHLTMAVLCIETPLSGG